MIAAASKDTLNIQYTGSGKELNNFKKHVSEKELDRLGNFTYKAVIFGKNCSCLLAILRITNNSGGTCCFPIVSAKGDRH